MDAQTILDTLAQYDDGAALEVAINTARDINATLDSNRWLLGDIAVMLETRYGDSVVDEYARGAALSRASAYEYRRIAGRFVGDMRERIQALDVGWSHIRIASRYDDDDAVLSWLEAASDNGWSVEALKYAIDEADGKPPRPVKLCEMRVEFARDASGQLVTRVIEGDVTALEDEAEYIVRVYQEQEDGTSDATDGTATDNTVGD